MAVCGLPKAATVAQFSADGLDDGSVDDVGDSSISKRSVQIPALLPLPSSAMHPAPKPSELSPQPSPLAGWLGQLPARAVGVQIPRVDFGSATKHLLPDKDRLEYEQYADRFGSYRNGKSLWKPCRHAHPIPLSGHHMMVLRDQGMVVTPDGVPLETAPLSVETPYTYQPTKCPTCKHSKADLFAVLERHCTQRGASPPTFERLSGNVLQTPFLNESVLASMTAAAAQFYKEHDTEVSTVGGGDHEGAATSNAEHRDSGAAAAAATCSSSSSSTPGQQLVLISEARPVTASVRGNLGPPEVVTQKQPATPTPNSTVTTSVQQPEEKLRDRWLTGRWQATSNMNGSPIKGPHWLDVDLGDHPTLKVAKVSIDFEAAYADDYTIEMRRSPSDPWSAITPTSVRKRTFGTKYNKHVVHHLCFGSARSISAPSPTSRAKFPFLVGTVNGSGDTYAASNLDGDGGDGGGALLLFAPHLRLHIAKGATGWGVSVWNLQVWALPTTVADAAAAAAAAGTAQPRQLQDGGMQHDHVAVGSKGRSSGMARRAEQSGAEKRAAEKQKRQEKRRETQRLRQAQKEEREQQKLRNEQARQQHAKYKQAHHHPKVPLITPGGLLPPYSMPMRLQHYSVRSVSECMQKAAFISSVGSLFTDQTNRGKQIEKRCHREDDEAEHWIEHATADNSIGNLEHATKIRT